MLTAKLKPLLYALAVAEFFTEEQWLFSSTDVSNRYLVKDSASYVGNVHELLMSVPSVFIYWHGGVPWHFLLAQ